jgi:Uma2 family endonuclease
MTRREFHRLYEQTPEDFRAELIGGVVYVSSPPKLSHGLMRPVLGSILCAYTAQSPGVECGVNTTVQLGAQSEPQPDLYLRILPEYGGQSRTTRDDYLAGAPEFVAEIAYSSRSIDLHAKLLDYARHGVREYVVLCLREGQLRWFDLPAGQELQADAAGICRMKEFPGLWVHVPALLARECGRLMATLQEGRATPEHAEFAARLAVARAPARKRGNGGGKLPTK